MLHNSGVHTFLSVPTQKTPTFHPTFAPFKQKPQSNQNHSQVVFQAIVQNV